jgi:activator of HSP90 ATPase
LEYLSYAICFPAKHYLDHILATCSHAASKRLTIMRFTKMAKISNRERRASAPTRRELITGATIAVGSLAVGLRLQAKTQQPSMKEPPATEENKERTSLHQEVDFKATPARVYEVLLDSKQFAAFSGMPAEIDAKAGGAFSMFQGMIVGRTVELVADQRIVQAWRPAAWPPGIYSLVKFELRPNGSGSTVVLDHTSFPQGNYDHLSLGWKDHYWEPLKKFLA